MISQAPQAIESENFVLLWLELSMDCLLRCRNQLIHPSIEKGIGYHNKGMDAYLYHIAQQRFSRSHLP